MIELKQTTQQDLETLFVFQTDETSNYMAAFTPKNPHDKDAYMNKWTRILANPNIVMKTIWQMNRIVGSVVHFTIGEETHVSYIIDKAFWGQGIATKALQMFIAQSPLQVFYARVAFDNHGSQRVLEKNSFQKIGLEKGFAHARGKEIEEFVYKYDFTPEK